MRVCNNENIERIIMTTPNESEKSENLINFHSESDDVDSKAETTEKSGCELLDTPKSLPDVDQSVTPLNLNEHKGYSRLCGYLNKLGNQKILKTFRKRWFIFSENNCKLYYYRSPHDQEPLGEIDIAQATFTFEVNNKERSGLFTISVPGRDYFLEASNRRTALFWLQELQKYRRANSLRRTRCITEQSTADVEFRGRPESGLVAESSPFTDQAEDYSHVPFIAPIDCPHDFIGDEVACSPSLLPSSFTSAQQKLNSFYAQVKSSGKNGKPSPESHSTNPGKESQDTSVTPPSNQKSAGSDGSSPGVYRSKPPGFSALKTKLSHSFRKSQRLEDETDDPNGKGCNTCKHLKIKMDNLEEELSNLRDEVSTSQEVRSLLQRQLDIASKEKETLVQIYQLKDSEESLRLLSVKDQEIVNLNHDLQEQKQAVEKLQRESELMHAELIDLRSNNELFQEMLKQKDNTIVNLTNEIFELETEKQDGKFKSETTPVMPNVETKEVMGLEELKDAVQAFELQNKFLNHEILELNQLRKDAEQRAHLHSMKCSEWEARSYQIQSKLLFLLNELNKNDGNLNQDVVGQLLEEAIGEGTAHTTILPSWSRDKMYDHLGFNWQWGKDDLLTLKASNLKQKSEDITIKSKDPELIAWRTKWDNFIVALGSKELQRSPELKLLVRSSIPHEYRGRMWKGCIHMWVKDYKSLLGPDYYNSLLTASEYVSRLDPSSKQIELDLLRTLPNNCHYESLDSDGVPKLRRVLLAYSRHDPVVGYCQGLNRLAAIALLFMDEEDAFWCLVAIIKFIMPDGYYTRTLITSHVDQKVLKDLMIDKLPRLQSHFEQNNVDLSLFTFNWFLTIYVDNVPVDIYLRIWDVFLYEGSKVLFRFALAFFKSCETELLQINDYLALNKYLRSIAEKCTDIKRLTHIAFNELNPFPQRTINSKRSHHFQIIRAQLEELEKERKTQKPRAVEKVQSFDYMSEED